MTFIGKQLVFLNTIVAFTLLTWAVMLYSHRVEWTQATIGEQKLPEHIASLQKQIQVARDAYYQARTPILAADGALVLYRLDTEGKLVEAQNGKFYSYITPTGYNPLSRDPIAGISRGPDGKERSLQGVNLLEKELTEQVEEAAAQLVIIDTNRKTRAELGIEILAYNTKATRLKEIFKELDSEKLYLSDNRVNWDEQLAVLKRRNDQLAQRLKELDTRPKTNRVPQPPVPPPPSETLSSKVRPAPTR